MHSDPSRRELFVSAARDLSSSAAQIDADMGAPVKLVTAPNGAIANKRLLDGIDKLGWVDTDRVLQFELADGSTAALHIRCAMAEFVVSPDEHCRPADVTLAHSGEAARLIDIFDRYKPEKAVVVPPAAFSPQR